MAQEIVPWIIGANAFLSIITIVYTFLNSGSSRLQKQIDGLKAEVEALEEEWSDKAEQRTEAIRREVRDGITELKEAVAMTSSRSGLVEKNVAVLESQLRQMPTHETMSQMQVSLARMEGQVATLAERIKPVAAVAARLQEQAMEESRR